MRWPGWRRPASGTPGERAEAWAARYLQRRGLEVEARNYRCRGGEIDLVARDGETLVFVEVRLRNHGGFGSPADSIDPRKQSKLARAAAHYLVHTRGDAPPPCRFDALSLCGPVDRDGEYRVEWLRDAFRPES